MKPSVKRSGSGNGGPSAASRSRPGKPIMKTVEMLRSNESLKRSGKGKETAVLRGLNDVIQIHHSLPGAVQVERFAEARAMEISALQTAVKVAAASNTSRAFQSLPRHLRRRAASHNPRRVPKYLKARAAAEIDPGDNIVQLQRRKAKLRARGNRKGQSRTQQLRLRQRGKAWLATHMYHAKRFHMTNIWGYRIPRTPTLKSFRSSYRAARRKASLRDTSFFGIIELESSRDRLLELLGRVAGGTSFAGARYEEGSYSAQLLIYEPGQFPHGLIGPAELFWQPSSGSSSTGQVAVWVRVHPSIFQETWRVLDSQAGDHIRMRDLRPELESFDLMGPLSGGVILRSLPFSTSESQGHRRAIVNTLTADAAAIPDGLTCSFAAVDPRLSYPPCHLSQDRSSAFEGDSPAVQTMDLWSRDCRLRLSRPTFKKAELDQRRRQAGLPGSRLTPTDRDDSIPVMIVKRQVGSDQERNAMIHGFTILFPKGWSMALLPSFVYCGVKLSGAFEAEVQHREAGVPSFPEHFGSVCSAGKQYEAAKAKEAERRWLRKPPGKRTEFSALSVDHPFKPDWDKILWKPSDCSSGGSTASPQPWLLDSSMVSILERLSRSKDPAASLLSAVNTFRQRRGMGKISKDHAESLYRSCLCHTRIDVLGRGSPADMAMIYSLSGDERSRWLQALEDVKTNSDSHSSEQLREGLTSARNTIGFVSTGNISLTRGKGHGLATVSVSAYINLLRAADSEAHPGTPVVLIRNRNSHTCRVAALQAVKRH